jgi:hypothetical protein
MMHLGKGKKYELLRKILSASSISDNALICQDNAVDLLSGNRKEGCCGAWTEA